jgi:hypothetical protein
MLYAVPSGSCAKMEGRQHIVDLTSRGGYLCEKHLGAFAAEGSCWAVMP